MSAALPHDPKWLRASSLLMSGLSEGHMGILGVPAYQTSLSPTSAHQTPQAIRNALSRYSTYSASTEIELSEMAFADLGDIDSPDLEEGESRVAATLLNAREKFQLIVALGGDNSITYSVAKGMWGDLSQVGLITLDAHHDIRDGSSNGSPVRRLLEAGLPGANIVQIGISDFANSQEYSHRARDYGIHVIHRDVLHQRSMSDVMAEALEIAGSGQREIYVDLDVDVCDRQVAPACPASLPGGISASELRTAARAAATDTRVRAIDITEIDSAMDTPDQRTVRLAALLVLETAIGVSSR